MARLHQWLQIADGRGKGIMERDRRDRFLKGGKKGKR